MADRGRLFYTSGGVLWEVDPNATIDGEPDAADLQPVKIGELTLDPVVIPADTATAGGGDSVVIGPNATDDDNPRAVVVGSTAQVGGDNTVAIGRNSHASFNDATAVGEGAFASGAATAFGFAANASGIGATVLGSGASTSANNAYAIGRGASATAQGAMAIGHNASIGTQNVIRVGGVSEQFVFPGVQDTLADANLNNSELTIEMDETASAFRIRGKDSGGVVREATVGWGGGS